MLKANAWPYPVFENLEFELLGATFEGRPLEHKTTSKGIIIDGQRLRALGSGTITVRAKINTATEDIIQYAFGRDGAAPVTAGFRVFCETSKFRQFAPTRSGEQHEIAIPLQMVRGGVQVAPFFTAAAPCITRTGVPLTTGAVIALAKDPLTITIDEDWTGEVIPIRWVNFATATPPLPEEALFHVELSGSGEVLPSLWLNEKFKDELGTVINHVGLNSPPGIAGHLMRQFLWLQFWQRALPWAIKYESEEQEEWPASRIAAMWKAIYTRNQWSWPRREEINIEVLEEMSTMIQHHLKQGEAIAQVRRLWQV
jgi:hypothetical protein